MSPRRVAVTAAVVVFSLILLLIGIPALRSIIAAILVASAAGGLVFLIVYEAVEAYGDGE